MPYTPEKPKLPIPTSELESRIPGWGVDRDPAMRPAVPKERYVAGENGAHWTFPERQVPRWKREKSTEHKMLTPVFGTAQPPKGLSGMIRRLAYRRYSEGQTAHWMLLVLADRIDMLESMVTETFRGRPDNPLKEYGLKAELKYNGLRSRVGRKRNDVLRLPVELLFTPAVWITVAGIVGIARKLMAPPPRHRRMMRRLLPAR